MAVKLLFCLLLTDYPIEICQTIDDSLMLQMSHHVFAMVNDSKVVQLAF